MPKNKPVDFDQITLIPVDFNQQIIKGSFEYTLHHLIGDTRPHFTTIAKFIAQLPGEIEDLFADVLAVCDCLDLIGKEMFAIDGCKISSNASKEWSGTKASFEKKRKKMEKEAKRLLEKHRKDDEAEMVGSIEVRQAEEKKIETMLKKIDKIESWLNKNTD
jgi:hypothetical protein